jgi:hypothetical protein
MFKEDGGQKISNLGYRRLDKELQSLLAKITEINLSTRDKKYYCPCYAVQNLTIRDILVFE